MKTLHVCVAAFNLLCLGAMASAFVVGGGSVKESLTAFAVVGGYFANLFALLVSAILLILLSIRAFSHRANSTLRAHWLGIANGGVVIFAWAVLFGFGRLGPRAPSTRTPKGVRTFGAPVPCAPVTSNVRRHFDNDSSRTYRR
jgi:hypothetical protein